MKFKVVLKSNVFVPCIVEAETEEEALDLATTEVQALPASSNSWVFQSGKHAEVIQDEVDVWSFADTQEDAEISKV